MRGSGDAAIHGVPCKQAKRLITQCLQWMGHAYLRDRTFPSLGIESPCLVLVFNSNIALSCFALSLMEKVALSCFVLSSMKKFALSLSLSCLNEKIRLVLSLRGAGFKFPYFALYILITLHY